MSSLEIVEIPRNIFRNLPELFHTCVSRTFPEQVLDMSKMKGIASNLILLGFLSGA